MATRMGDLIRASATTIVAFSAFLLLIFLWVSPDAHGDFDLTLGGQYRSYPPSGYAAVEAGYGVLLWGTVESPWYGYLRPRVEAGSVGSYSAADAGFEVYPLAFFGVRAGGESVQNDEDYRAYDCDSYVCQGRFYRTYILSELSLGAGPVFTQVRLTRERWVQGRRNSSAFIEPTSGLALPGAGASQSVMRAVVGWKISPIWTVMAGYNLVRADRVEGEAENLSRFPFGLLRWTQRDWTIGVGGGAFSSTIKRREATAIVFVEWAILPSIRLR